MSKVTTKRSKINLSVSTTEENSKSSIIKSVSRTLRKRVRRCIVCGKVISKLESLESLLCGEVCVKKFKKLEHEQRDCSFCRMISINSKEDKLQFHTSGVVSFTPENPVAIGHRTFIPLQHVSNAAKFPTVTGRVFAIAAAHASLEGTHFNLITCSGLASTQEVFHLQVQYIPREEDDGLLLPWSSTV